MRRGISQRYLSVSGTSRLFAMRTNGKVLGTFSYIKIILNVSTFMACRFLSFPEKREKNTDNCRNVVLRKLANGKVLEIISYIKIILNISTFMALQL